MLLHDCSVYTMLFPMKLLIMILYAVEDLKANTEYTGYTTASTAIQWFWEVVKGFSKEDMARFLQFVTGTSKVSRYHCTHRFFCLIEYLLNGDMSWNKLTRISFSLLLHPSKDQFCTRVGFP